MPGPFDSAANMADPYAAATGISPFLSPAYHRWSSIADALGGMGQALVAASSPSPYPQDFGSVFGALGAGAARAGQGFEDRALKRALTGAQVAMANQKVQQYQDWRKLFGAGTPSPAETATSPVAPIAMPTELIPTAASPTAAPSGAPNPNNIGNVRMASGTGFHQPADFNAGVNLAVGNVQAYPKQFNNGQPMTLIQIGERWAPKGDGKNDPMQWAKNVSSISGLPVDQPLDLSNPQVQAAFARGVHGAEWGANSVRPVSDYSTALAQSGVPQPGAPTAPPIQPPKTFAQVLQTVPPGVRSMIAAMGPEEGMKQLLKYADPESVPAQDARTGQVVFAPKTALGSGQFIPLDASKLALEREKFGFEQKKFATEQSQTGEWVRGADGKERWVQKAQLSPGMEKTDKPPDPGTESGDVALLKRGQDEPAFVKTPEYAAAYNRRSEPKMSQNGMLQYPDMSAYPKPGGGQVPGGVRIEDTPGSRFQMSRQLRDDFNQLKPVKDWREVAPIYESVKDAMSRDNKVSDLNLVYGIAKIMDPGSVVREGETVMVRNTQSLPDWIKQSLQSAIKGSSAFTPEHRQRILAEIESRVAPLKSQYDNLAAHTANTAKNYGLSADEIINSPITTLTEPSKAPQAAAPTFDFKPGQGLVPR